MLGVLAVQRIDDFSRNGNILTLLALTAIGIIKPLMQEIPAEQINGHLLLAWILHRKWIFQLVTRINHRDASHDYKYLYICQ